jgi:hypothetical protein
LVGETEVLGENLPRPYAALSTTNPTCYPDANPGRNGGTGRFTFGETAPGAPLDRGRVGTRADLDAVEKRKISASAKNRTPIPWFCSQETVIMTELLEYFSFVKLNASFKTMCWNSAEHRHI